MRRLRLALLFAAGCAENNDIPSPLIASIVPDHGPTGAVVMVAGSYFCQRPDNGQEDPTCDTAGTVNFGTVPGIAVTWADDAIMVEVPGGGPTKVSVTITAAGRLSNAVPFTID
jgi:hypothetical protein